MIRKHRFVALWSVPFIMIMFATGCNNTSPGSMQDHAAQPVAPSSAASPEMNQPSTAAAVAIPDEKPKEEAVNPNDKVSLASAESPAQASQDAGETKPVAAKPQIDIQAPYNQAKPTLLGLTLNASPEAVTGKYGTPKAQFVMEDDSDPITVYDYADFLVGFNKKNQLQFIDVRSSQINPGLNGLKLGQTSGDAIKALGKPDTNTSFVLTYKSTGAVLKLDVDPKSENVNSIKLFAAE
jgi:hypothetical protein